jgi:cob(I)alamin adenosyltransferase
MSIWDRKNKMYFGGMAGERGPESFSAHDEPHGEGAVRKRLLTPSEKPHTNSPAGPRARILIFTGDGKGKTSAALGMAFRAAGHGLRTCMVQFIKSDATVGEIAAAAGSDTIEIHPTGLGFLPAREHPDFALHRQAAQAGLRMAAEAVADGRYSLVVLDEVLPAVARGLIEQAQVAELVARTPPQVCLVLTGRHAPPALIDLADTVTEMRCVKHGFQAGIAAQKGVER